MARISVFKVAHGYDHNVRRGQRGSDGAGCRGTRTQFPRHAGRRACSSSHCSYVGGWLKVGGPCQLELPPSLTTYGSQNPIPQLSAVHFFPAEFTRCHHEARRFNSEILARSLRPIFRPGGTTSETQTAPCSRPPLPRLPQAGFPKTPTTGPFSWRGYDCCSLLPAKLLAWIYSNV